MTVRKNNVQVGLLQFAHDTLFLCQIRYQNVVTIKCIMRVFKKFFV